MLKCLTSDIITAQEALDNKLASRVLPTKEALMAEAFRLASRIAEHSYYTTTLIKRSIRNSLQMGVTDGIRT